MIPLLAKLQTYFYLSSVSTKVLFLFQDPNQHFKWHPVIVSPQSLLVCDSFLDFPCFSWPRQLWGALVRHFIECPSVQACLMFSNDFDWCYGFWEGHTEMKCLSHSIISRGPWHSLNTIDVTLDHLVHVVSARSLYCKVEIFSFHTLILGSKLLNPASIQEGED